MATKKPFVAKHGLDVGDTTVFGSNAKLHANNAITTGTITSTHIATGAIESAGGASNSYLTSTFTSNTVFQSALANTNTRISGNDTDIADRMQVANTQALHTALSANISQSFTDIQSTNTSIRSLVSDRMQVANTVALANARLGATATVQITGDVAGGPTAFSGNTVSIAVTQQNNSVDLGTHTTGNYVATISGTQNEVEVSGSGSETAAVTIGLPNDVTLTGDLTVSGGDITLGGTGRIQGVDTVSAGTDAANKTYVDTAVAGIVDSAPSTLDTLNELAAALGDDANFATTTATNIGQKLGATASITLTGAITGSGSFSSNAVSITTSSGIGINAATLDSLDSTQFLRSDAADTKTSGDLSFADNVKAIFGAGSDLQIYHAGTSSRIQDVGTGNLIIDTDGTEIQITSGSVAKYMLRAVKDGDVKIYYDNAQKLTTTATGVDITGTLTADGLTVVGNSTLTGDATLNGINSDLILQGGTSGSQDCNEILWRTTTSNGYDLAKIKAVTGTNFYDGNLVFQTQKSGLAGTLVDRMRLENTGDISFYDSTGVTQGFFWDASTQRLGLGTTSPAGVLDVEWNANSAGTGLYLQNDNAGTSAFAGVYFGNDVSNTDAFIGLNSSTNTQYGGTRSLLIGTNASSSVAFMTGGTQKAVITSAGKMGINLTAPSYALDVRGISSYNSASFRGQGASVPTYLYSDTAYWAFGDAPSYGGNLWGGHASNNQLYAFTNGSERLRIDSSGKVGIGTSPDSELHIDRGQVNIRFGYNNLSQNYIDTDTQVFRSGNGATEYMRLDSSGNLLVGKTSLEYENTAGHIFRADGLQSSIRSGGNAADFNRLSSDGEIIRVSKDGTTVGSIGTDTTYGELYISGAGNRGGLGFYDIGFSGIQPVNSDGSLSDGDTNLGYTSSRFKDLYLSSDIYVGDQIIHDGDTDTYTQFHNANEWRVVTGGTEMLEVNNDTVNLGANSVGNVETASKTGAVTPNLEVYNSFVWTLTGNITLNNPATELTGMSGVFVFIHSGAGRTVSLGTDWETAGGAGLTLSSTSGAVDIVPYYVQASGNILLGTPQLAFS